MKTNFNKTAFGFLLAVFFFASCNHKEDDSTPETTTSTTSTISNTPTGQLYFHLHTYIDNNEIDLYNTNYTTDGGRKMSLQLAQLYISDIQLVKLDGSTVSIADRHILMQQDIATYLIGNVPVGNYNSVRFKVGLDAVTNALNPPQSADSIILNRSEMWFDSAPQPDGYVFVVAKGKIDTSANADNSVSQMQSFEYKIGNNNHYVQINMPDKKYSVYQNQIEYVHVIVDYYKLFNGVKLNDPLNLFATSAAQNSQVPATNIANNIPLMFRYEE